MKMVLVRCRVPYSWSYRQALQCSYTRYWRSSGVISELSLSSRDVVKLGAPLGRVLLEKLVVAQLVKFSACYGTRRFITVITTAKLNAPALVVSFYSVNTGTKGNYEVTLSGELTERNHIVTVCYR